MEPKSLHSTNACQTIHRQYQILQQQLHVQIDHREEAENNIQRLTDEYFAAVNDEDRQRVTRERDAAVADRQLALQLIERIEREMQDVENDYFITGCEELLGNL